jgi:hypothetical protein
MRSCTVSGNKQSDEIHLYLPQKSQLTAKYLLFNLTFFGFLLLIVKLCIAATVVAGSERRCDISGVTVTWWEVRMVGWKASACLLSIAEILLKCHCTDCNSNGCSRSLFLYKGKEMNHRQRFYAYLYKSRFGFEVWQAIAIEPAASDQRCGDVVRT